MQVLSGCSRKHPQNCNGKSESASPPITPSKKSQSGLMQTASQSAIGQDALAYSESEIDLDPSKLTPQKNIVRSFYKEVWDRAETRLIPEIFHENFTFRGSLG